MRIRTTAAALAAAAVAAALLGLAAHASGAPADRPGLRLYDETLGRTREAGATVCTFFFRAEGFGPDQPVNWTVSYARGEDAVVGTLVTGAQGTGSTDRVVLADGAYRFRWAGSDAKPQGFTVACPDGTATPTPTPHPGTPSAGAVPGVTAAASTGPGTGLPGTGLTSATTSTGPSTGPSDVTAGVAAALAALGIASVTAFVMLCRKPAPRRHRRVSG
ncbi:hypothetical protein [Actinacidiphila sp. bgisy160]|uniref:hypothetical protein n=1 Tax=Actinacidiphila sp. bgisy160 TaxID=3413796 RepID=UPI003D727F91